MFDNTLSLCMIVKNEEKNLARCLSSVASIVDEIIIVDTGSTDNTVSIAKSYGAKVYYHKWENDFSLARNVSLEKATKNWVLFLDADEELDHEEAIRLKNILQLNSRLEAFHLRLVNIISNTNIGDAIVLRVFKNKQKYRFEGRMHEQIVKSIERNNPPGCIGATDVKINHYGYDPELADIEQKQKRNLDLLNSYPEDQRDGYFYYSLGNEYARLNEHDKALKTYYKALSIPLNKDERPVYMAYLYLHIAKVLNASKNFKEELQRLHEFQEKYYDFKDLYFMEGLAYLECNKPSEAKTAFINYLTCKQEHYEYPCSNFEKHYDINTLIKNCESVLVPHENNLLSVLMLCTENDPTLIDTIKSVNEIADEVIICIPKSSKLNKTSLENLCATVLEFDDNDRENMFMVGSSKCTGKYTLLLKPREVCTFETKKDLINIISNSYENYFNVRILDSKTGSTSDEFRLFKNSDVLKNFKTFSEYAQYIHSHTINSFKVNIHKI
ncbi:MULTISPECIES: glycosyltransferase [Peptostreptococcaceae]|uniref:glycosyltransferase n=1 Tax=Peptostreptococcaceae TaxID=186804 RepID=UPI003F3C1914